LIPNTSTGEISFVSKGNKQINGRISYEPDLTNTRPIEFTKSYVNTSLKLEGDPFLINDFFKTKDFIFRKGNFKVLVDYKGDIASLEELFNEGTATFELKDSEVYYKAIGLSLPLNSINLTMQNDLADFGIFMRSDSLKEEMSFVGKVDNISELVVGNTGKKFSTTLDMYSPVLSWNNLLLLLVASEQGASQNRGMGESLKKSIKEMLTFFDPNFHLQIDEFIYSPKLKVRNFKTGLYLKDSTQLILDNTGFEYQKGSIGLNAEVDMHTKRVTPFKVALKTSNLDLAGFLNDVDYLNIEELANAENLKGQIDLNMNLSAILHENGRQLITEKTKAKINFTLSNVEIKGLSIVDSLAAKYKMKKRFAHLKFAPISNRITVNGSQINIPQMEFVSNALHLFAEGYIDLEGDSNLWFSIPFNNLKRKKKNGATIPVKSSYISTKNKFYMVYDRDETGQSNFGFRISKRKFYKDRGILDLYKVDKKAARKARKAAKRSGEK